MNVKYSIINRSEILIEMDEKRMIAQGEIIIDPPSFNVYYGSIKEWETPYQNEEIDDGLKYRIIKALLDESRKEDNVRLFFD